MVSLDSIIAKQVANAIDKGVDAGAYGISFAIIFFVGYAIGYVISHVIWRILNLSELQKALVKYGAMTTKLWSSTSSFLAQYLKWYITIAVLTTMELRVIDDVYELMGQLFWFIILTIVGLFLGGICYKILKEALIAIGLEAELKKHKIVDAFGGMSLSGILAGIVKWYIVLLFLAQGIAKLPLLKLSVFMDELMIYIPNLIMGLMILIVAMVISNFVGGRLREKKVNFAEFLALGAEALIFYFAIVLALPKFGVGDVSILEDSFKILMVGISVGIAIALGLGLKDPISKLCEKHTGG